MAKIFRSSTRRALGALVASMLALSPASAQFFLPPPPPPLPPGEATAILRHDLGFRRVGPPEFTGRFYLMNAVDHAGAQVRVVMHARTGRIIEVEEIVPAPRHLPPPATQRSPVAPRERAAALTTLSQPVPPRRPSARADEQAPPAARPPAQAARPPAAEPRTTPPPVNPPAVTPPVTVAPPTPQPAPILNIERGAGPADPQTVRLPSEADKAPPLARPTGAQGASAPAEASQSAPAARDGAPIRDVTRQPLAAPPAAPPAAANRSPAPGAMAPAPLDDATRRPSAPVTTPVAPAPLL